MWGKYVVVELAEHDNWNSRRSIDVHFEEEDSYIEQGCGKDVLYEEECPIIEYIVTSNAFRGVSVVLQWVAIFTAST